MLLPGGGGDRIVAECLREFVLLCETVLFGLCCQVTHKDTVKFWNIYFQSQNFLFFKYIHIMDSRYFEYAKHVFTFQSIEKMYLESFLDQLIFWQKTALFFT